MVDRRLATAVQSEMMKYDAREPQRDPTTAPKMKRLTIDVSADLHSAIKVDCARRGIKMADAIRGLLTNEFGREVD